MAISNASSNFRPGVCTSTTRPEAPFNGQVIYEVDTKQTLVWQGSAWVMLTDADQPPGLQLVKTQTVGSGVSSVTVTDAFSADYDNYLIQIAGVVFSTTGFSWYVQIGGQASNYYGSQYYDYYTGSPTGITRSNAGGGLYIGVQDDNNASATITVMNPNKAKITNFHALYYGGGFSGNSNGTHAVATAYTSFTMAAGSGTMTGGTIRVYGYRN